METPDRVVRGPMALLGWAVSVAWLAVGVFSWLRFDDPLRWVFAGVSLAAALATALVSWGLQVRLGPTGVRSAGGREVAWEDIDHIGVRRGFVSVPYLAVRMGRALDDVPLDGIAAFRSTGALRLAEEVAEAGSLGEVRVAGGTHRSGRGRRGIPG